MADRSRRRGAAQAADAGRSRTDAARHSQSGSVISPAAVAPRMIARPAACPPNAEDQSFRSRCGGKRPLVGREHECTDENESDDYMARHENGAAPLPSGSQKPLTSKGLASEVRRYRHFAYYPPCWRGYLLVRSK